MNLPMHYRSSIFYFCQVMSARHQDSKQSTIIYEIVKSIRLQVFTIYRIQYGYTSSQSRIGKSVSTAMQFKQLAENYAT